MYEKLSLPKTLAYPETETTADSSNTSFSVAAKNCGFGDRFHLFPTNYQHLKIHYQLFSDILVTHIDMFLSVKRPVVILFKS